MLTNTLNTMDDTMPNGGGVLSENNPTADPMATVAIGKKEIKKAWERFKEYKSGKSALEQRIVDNEQWYKMRHWDKMRKQKNTENEPRPASGWLFNTIMNKHADCMDSYPIPAILPREEGDRYEAKMLSDIIPCILEQNEFTDTYSGCSWYKLKNGTSMYGAFWDSNKLNGLGDISIEKIDLLNLFWEPGITDIQKSKDVFYVHMMDIDVVEAMYPDLKGKIKSDTNELKKYVYDDNIRTDKKCLVVDWYYKKQVGMKQVLHYCKFVGDEILYASENETQRPTATQIVSDMNGNPVPVEVETGKSMAERGWYDHGQYPFVPDVLFPEEGSLTGFGFIDIGKEAQESIDRLNNDIEINARWGARPRWFSRTDGGINEDEYNDLSRAIIHVDSNLGDDTLREIPTNTLSSIYLQILQDKVTELKETTGNRDVASGGTTAGVTAASGIAALQEQAGKSSRDMIQASYRAYSKLINLVIELIRQFYDLPRQFRITGQQGQEQFVTYDNAMIQAQPQLNEFGEEMGSRLPVFDIKVSAQKASPYSKVSQNELALQLYNQGFFNPELSDQALACLDMMDFDDKDAVIQKVSQNGTMFQQIQQLQMQLLQLAEITDAYTGEGMAEGIASSINGGGGAAIPQGGGNVSLPTTDAMGGLKAKENGVVAKARQNASNATAPR